MINTTEYFVSGCVVLAIVLISCISAKRFNFFHGFIVFVTLSFLIVGVYETLIHFELFGDFTAEFGKYIISVYNVVLPLLTFLIDKLKLDLNDKIWLLCYVPILLWIVSRIFAGLLRSSRDRYRY